MATNFDNVLGISQQALKVRQQRTEVLASNIANADTPGYKARDIDFRAALSSATLDSVNLQTTHESHLSLNQSTPEYMRYRVPDQPSVDGNTVDIQQEKAAVADNSVRYQATLSFLSRKFSGMVNAFRGE